MSDEVLDLLSERANEIINELATQKEWVITENGKEMTVPNRFLVDGGKLEKLEAVFINGQYGFKGQLSGKCGTGVCGGGAKGTLKFALNSIRSTFIKEELNDFLPDFIEGTLISEGPKQGSKIFVRYDEDLTPDFFRTAAEVEKVVAIR